MTIKEVARETDVHEATDSRALSQSSRAELSAEVVAKVRKTAEAMGYRPIRVAAGPGTCRTIAQTEDARLLDVLMQRGMGIVDAAVARVNPYMERLALEVPIVTANRMVEGTGIPVTFSDEGRIAAEILRKRKIAPDAPTPETAFISVSNVERRRIASPKHGCDRMVRAIG